MTQRFSLYEDLSIRENLEFVARVYGVPDPRRARAEAHRPARARRAALTSLPAQLSGGWKQRLALGACMLHEPQAAAARRADRRRRSQGAARVLGRDPPRSPREGITVLVSTHYMDEAERCHEIAYIAYGELLAQRHGRTR
mgnify:CR=1 FL=1